jgi:GrpB protein/Polyketide cyclase / dehydrase and lipid transport
MVTVVLHDNSGESTRQFERERECIVAALGNTALSVHHTGSTSVHGVMAKPVIDVQGWQDAAMTSERIEVKRAIAAEPAAVFSVLRDPKGHVAIDSSGMLMSATGDPAGAVGDTFVVHMDREALNDYPLGLYDVTVTITAFEQDREIAWTILGQLRPQIGHVYGYRLEPIEQGTLVTSYYDWSDIDPVWKERAIFPVISEGALRATLGILARTVAPGVPRPALPDDS